MQPCAAGDGGDERHFGSVAQRALSGREFLVDRKAQPFHDGTQLRVSRASGLARLGGGRALAQLEDLARNAGSLPRGSEVEHRDAHRSSERPPATAPAGGSSLYKVYTFPPKHVAWRAGVP